MADTLETIEIEVKHRATGAAEEINRVASAVRSLSNALGKTVPSASQGVKEMTKAVSKAKTPLENFVSSLKRIAFYRFIRSIIKSITQAFSEGLEKAYVFSSRIAGEGHRFATALDQMQSKTNQLKGQLGSAFAALLTAIAPILETIINLITRVADAISQFFAAFTGSTYIKAIAAQADFADKTAKGAKAAKDFKNQLMKFDEINRLEDKSSSGSGGKDPLKGYDFKDTEIDKRIKAIVDKVKEIINVVKERLEPAINRAKEAWDRFTTAMGKFAQNFNGSWLDFMITDLLTLGGDLVLGGLTALIDSLTVLVELFNALETGDWSGFSNALDNLFRDVTEWIDQLKKDLLLIIIDALIPVAEAFDQAFGTDVADHLRQTRDNILGLESPLDVTDQELKVLQETVKETGIVTKDTTSELTLSAQDATSSVSAVGGAFTDVQFILQNFKMPSFHITGWENTDLVLGPGGTYPISLPNLGFFAKGGFPDEGQLFVAREAGAEMVGQLGGRTAVANNDQIIAGIEAGVFRAMSSAMSGQNGSRDVRVYLDGKEIGAASRRYERNISRATGVAMA